MLVPTGTVPASTVGTVVQAGTYGGGQIYNWTVIRARPGRQFNMPDESVKVVVRVRPLSRKEQQNGHLATTVADEDQGTITCNNPKSDIADPPKVFTFDAVFASGCNQKSIYDKCGATVVEAVLDGYNGTVFAYGQTGAGKTFTMEGLSEPPELRGIIPNAFQHIFDKVALAAEQQHFLVRASYLEIYNEEIRDLLYLSRVGY